MLLGQCATAGPAGGEHGELGVEGVHVVRQHRPRTDQPVVVVGVDVVGAVAGTGRATVATSVRFSLTWEVKNAPSTSVMTAAHAASTASEAESEKRGVTAYRARPRPCQRDARATASACARSGVVSSGSGSIRSLTTRPLVTRSPKRAASANSASTAGAKWDPKTSEVVVPAATSPPTSSLAIVAA